MTDLNDGQYSVVTSNYKGDLTSSTLDVQVETPPSEVTVEQVLPYGKSPAADETVVLTCTAVGHPAANMTFDWLRNGATLTTFDSLNVSIQQGTSRVSMAQPGFQIRESSLTIHQMRKGDEGEYR